MDLRTESTPLMQRTMGIPLFWKVMILILYVVAITPSFLLIIFNHEMIYDCFNITTMKPMWLDISAITELLIFTFFMVMFIVVVVFKDRFNDYGKCFKVILIFLLMSLIIVTLVDIIITSDVCIFTIKNVFAILVTKICFSIILLVGMVLIFMGEGILFGCAFCCSGMEVFVV